jgi:hypothetical protein
VAAQPADADLDQLRRENAKLRIPVIVNG